MLSKSDEETLDGQKAEPMCFKEHIKDRLENRPGFEDCRSWE